MLHTTFTLLRRAGACEMRYRKLAKSLGGVTQYGRDTPIPLSTVIGSNGTDDALWCLQATIEPSEGFSRDFSCDCADSVASLLTDERSIAAIAVSRRHARGQATDLSAALVAASAAASAAAMDAVSVAASAAASAAAMDAASAAASAAAWVAARGAASAAAWVAVWGSASASAWVAVWGAASAAAWVAARGAISNRFAARLEAHDPDTNPLGEVPEQMPCLVNLGDTPCAA